MTSGRSRCAPNSIALMEHRPPQLKLDIPQSSTLCESHKVLAWRRQPSNTASRRSSGMFGTPVVKQQTPAQQEAFPVQAEMPFAELSNRTVRASAHAWCRCDQQASDYASACTGSWKHMGKERGIAETLQMRESLCACACPWPHADNRPSGRDVEAGFDEAFHCRPVDMKTDVRVLAGAG